MSAQKAEVKHEWPTMQGYQWHVEVNGQYFVVSYSRFSDETLAFKGHKNNGKPASLTEVTGARGECLDTILDRLTKQYGKK